MHTVVEATARQARADSTADLQHHQQQAQRAAQHRARRLVSTARPGPRSTHARYDAAARLLREWYLTVHDTTLEHNLHGHSGHAASIPGAADVETTAAQVARIRTGDDPHGPLRATALLWRIARTDADTATLATYKALRSRRRRAIVHEIGLSTISQALQLHRLGRGTGPWRPRVAMCQQNL